MSTQIETGRAILREVDVERRFWRNWLLYLLFFGTAIAIALSPGAWPWYVMIFLAGTVFLAVTIYLEEAVNKWLDRAIAS